jgi:hypothetical protein
MNKSESKHIQFLFTKTIDGVLFKERSFYCLDKISQKIVIEDGRYVKKEEYTFTVNIEGEDKLFTVTEDYAVIIDACPIDSLKDIKQYLYERDHDTTKDVFKAVKEATGHDMTDGWYGQEAWTAEDLMGIPRRKKSE